MPDNKHRNYEILNLIGYGLAKFDTDFSKQLGYRTKQALYKSLVDGGIADTPDTVKNRQDLFDPFFDNGRKGWWQKGDAYLHRKKFIDALFGEYDVQTFARLVRIHLKSQEPTKSSEHFFVSPVIKSKFKQLQATGREAEIYFADNFERIEGFRGGVLEDARLFGDGYDFQIQLADRFVVAEIKGLRRSYGSVRLTSREFECAREYREDYGLVVVSNLEDLPKMSPIFDPIRNLKFERKSYSSDEVTYHSANAHW